MPFSLHGVTIPSSRLRKKKVGSAAVGLSRARPAAVLLATIDEDNRINVSCFRFSFEGGRFTREHGAGLLSVRTHVVRCGRLSFRLWKSELLRSYFPSSLRRLRN